MRIWPGNLLLCALLLTASCSLAQDESPDKPQDKQDEKQQEKTQKKKKKHPANRLAKEQSPYLQQHAHNPVDWYPWGPEAFAKAKKENKLVFLSIGYATCHWCHVMERESFENEEVAKVLNASFVCIKVDREERPDVDKIYMSAIQMVTGRGGWPLSIFLTPDAQPLPNIPEFQRAWGSALTGGTYFPQPARFGRRSFMDEIKIRARLWKEHRKELTADAGRFAKALGRYVSENRGENESKLSVSALQQGVKQLRESFDAKSGGFPGSSRNPTRFPMPHNMSFLMRYYRRTGDKVALSMALKTLDAIWQGGLRDHLGGGFHRYSVDPEWEIPHFEKMLYDQAGLVRAFVEAHQITGKPVYADVARETLEYVLREMRHSGGGFTSAWDADSEGKEGKFYVWDHQELKKLLGGDYALFAARYSVTERGNFHDIGGHLNHLQLDASLPDLAKKHKKTVAELKTTLAACRKKLFETRGKRIPPLHDDKVLTDWNGLMIGAAAYAGRSLGEPRYTEAARRAAVFVFDELRKDGELLHRWRGKAGITAMLEDYAYLAWGVLDLYEATQDPRWLKEARWLVTEMLEHFWDDKKGGFFQVRADAKLIARPKPTYDGARPAGNSVAALALLRTGTLTQDAKLMKRGEATLRWYGHILTHNGGRAATLGLQALDFLLGPVREIVIAGDPEDPITLAMLREVHQRFLPRTVLLHRPLGDAKELVALVPFLKDQVAVGGKPTAYVCENFTCKEPVNGVKALRKLLE